jgi:hypothetical protein
MTLATFWKRIANGKPKSCRFVDTAATPRDAFGGRAV